MANKTQLEKDILAELVRRDAALREGRYSDAYLSRISQMYSLVDVLGSRIVRIVKEPLPTKCENKVVVLPLLRFIEYCVKQGK